MKPMQFRFASAFLGLSLALAQTPQKPADWQKVDNPPNVDFSPLTPAQKKTALAAMRAQPCLCGCAMRIAECRIKDPNCSDSRAMAEIIVKAIKDGRDPAEAMSNSDLVKRKSGAPDVLEAPVTIPTAGSPVRGQADARITLVEFSDFECPFCSKAAAKIEAIQQAYPKDVRLIYKQYPLDSHPHAKIAAAAALAAHAQNKFWPMHDKLFANFNKLSQESIVQIAKDLNLDMTKFQADMHSPKTTQTILKDVNDGEKAQVDSTPTVFINGRRYNGPIELVVLKPILDSELKKK
jgi:protein-disulfide isomerase